MFNVTALRRGLVVFSALSSTLWLGGCAAAEQASVERDLRDGAVAQTVYHLPLAALSEAARNALTDQGYRLLGDAARTDLVQTDWKCSGSLCNAVKVIILPVDADHFGVFARRTAYEGGSSVVTRWERAFDVEWAMLRQLDPQDASVIEASAREKAPGVLKAQAEPWQH